MAISKALVVGDVFPPFNLIKRFWAQFEQGHRVVTRFFTVNAVLNLFFVLGF